MWDKRVSGGNSGIAFTPDDEVRYGKADVLSSCEMHGAVMAYHANEHSCYYAFFGPEVCSRLIHIPNVCAGNTVSRWGKK